MDGDAMRVIGAIILFVATGLALGGSEQVPVDSRLELVTVATGFDLPIGLAFIGPDEMLVAQRTDGRVIHVVGSVAQGTVLDLAVDSWGEMGLLSLVTDPDFIHNGFVYLHYTESSTGDDTVAVTPLGNRTYRYRWDGSALVEPRLILDLPFKRGVHNGGVLKFGPDDRLYLMAGDNARCCTPPNTGQLQNNPTGTFYPDTGVVLRVSATGAALPDNPFFDASDFDDPMNRYYSYGHRNSFGIGFDPVSGDLWQTEAGPQDYDELNRIVPGMNGGWMQIHGLDALDPEGVDDLWMVPGAVYRDPELVWLENITPIAVGFVDTPKLGCEYRDDLVVATLGCRVLYRFDLDAGRTSIVLPSPELADRVVNNAEDWCEGEHDPLLFTTGPIWNSDAVTDIDVGPDGLLYLVSYSHGSILRMQPVPGAFVDADADQVEAACDCDETDATAYGVPVEVPRLRVAGPASTTLGWDSQAGTAGSGTTYTVVTGRLSELQADGGYTRACALEDGLAAPGATDGRPVPGGDGHYYLVRAGNGCDDGTFGDGSPPPDPRDTLDALSPPPSCFASPVGKGDIPLFPM